MLGNHTHRRNGIRGIGVTKPWFGLQRGQQLCTVNEGAFGSSSLSSPSFQLLLWEAIILRARGATLQRA
eukprot:4673544-Amphidinium_carterae.2